MKPWIPCLLALAAAGCSSSEEAPPPAQPTPAASDPDVDPLAPPRRTAPPTRAPRAPQPRSSRPDAPPPQAPAWPPATPPAPPGSAPARPAPLQDGVTLALHDVDVRAAVAMLAELAGVEVELSPWVRGRVTVSVEGKPWRYALTRILVGVGEFELLGNGDRVRVVPRQLRVSGVITRVTAEALIVQTAGASKRLRFPSAAAGGEAARRRADLLRALRGSQPGDRVVCGAAFLQGVHHLTAVLTRPGTEPLDPAPAPGPPPPTSEPAPSPTRASF